MKRLHFGCFLILALIVFSCSKKDNTPDPPAASVPACTQNTSPANGATVTAGSVVNLTWVPVSNATTYDVYLGTSTVPATTIATNISVTTLNYTVPSTAGVTYYWYVVPKNSAGAALSCGGTRVSSFATTSIIIAPPPPFGFYVVGYFPDYRAIADVPDVKFRMCNVVNYAFATVNTSNTLTIGNTTHMTQLITKAKANGAKVMLAIANPGSGNNFKTMASTPAGRTTFVADVMAKVRQYGFDGADIDWEFPTTSDGTHLTFTALMKELSDSLHRDARYYLSAALTAGIYAGGIRDAIQTEVFGYADFFNIMAYDDFSTTVPYKHHSSIATANASLNYWITQRGMPAAKCVLGIPAYGRASGITQSGTTMSYRSILAQGGNPLLDSAVVSQGSFTNYTIYYNGQKTVKDKTMQAKLRGNGVMFWEKWQDTHDATSLLKAACDTIGRAY